MATEVKLSMKAGDYQDLMNLLRFIARKITEEQYRAMLTSRGYRDPIDKSAIDNQNAYLAEQAIIVLE